MAGKNTPAGRGFVPFVLQLSAPVKVLLLNNLGFNLGFYMLLPYLTTHLTDGLGYAAGFAGFVAGLRMLSQQGLFLVGGTLADRFNYQTVIMTGCALRVAGFALFAVVVHPFGVVAAAFLTGFAGALFSPAYQALVARLTEGEAERERIYALQNVTTEAGAFGGPLIGLVLLRHGFGALCTVASGVFFALLLLQWAYLPRLEGSEHASPLPVWDDWKKVFGHGNFILFSFLMSVYYLMFNQLYVLLPLSSPDSGSVAGVFTLSAVLGITLQMPVSALAVRFLSRSARLGVGLGLMSLSFLFLLPDLGSLFGLSLGSLLTSAVLTVGTLVVFPPAISMVPELGGERRQGVCFGVFYLFAGIAGATGGGTTAWLWQRSPVFLVTALTFTGLCFSFLLWLHSRSMECRPCEQRRTA